MTVVADFLRDERDEATEVIARAEGQFRAIEHDLHADTLDVGDRAALVLGMSEIVGVCAARAIAYADIATGGIDGTAPGEADPEVLDLLADMLSTAASYTELAARAARAIKRA